MEAAGIEEGELAGEPLKAIAAMGDPAQVTMSGLIAGAAEIPKILAGGTQMAAVLAIVDQIDPSARDRLAIGTTKWILRDPSSDLVSLVRQVGDVPIMAANLDFSSLKHSGLRAYESGVVKEGVGAGGVSISAMTMTSGQITVLSLQQEIEREYERILGGKAS
jgi:NaMN:DMB phosphoribosyltransferase